MSNDAPKRNKIRSIQKRSEQNAASTVFDFPKDEPGVLYVRQSSIKQVQNNIHSFEMQTDKFLEYCREVLECVETKKRADRKKKRRQSSERKDQLR